MLSPLTLPSRLRVPVLQERDDRKAEAMGRMTQLLERICNQNMQKDIISDFKVCSSSSSHSGPMPNLICKQEIVAACACACACSNGVLCSALLRCCSRGAHCTDAIIRYLLHP